MEKPRIACPHCDEHIEASSLPPNRKYRNASGIDVFGCPTCGKNLKFDPQEYFAVRELMSKGEMPSGMAIDGTKEEDSLPSERAANSVNDSPQKKSGIFEKILGCGVILALIAYLFLR